MKYYVLDTNVLLSEGKQALYSFETHNVVIPMAVLQELDNKKTSPDLGYVARSVLKEIKSVFSNSVGKKSAPLGDGHGSLHIATARELYSSLDDSYLPATSDGEILATAMVVRKQNPLTSVVIVTKDTQFTILATLNNFEVQDLIVENKSELTKHVRHVETYYVPDEDIDYLHKKGKVSLDPQLVNVPQNVGVILVSASDPQHSALAISGKNWDYVKVNDAPCGKITGKNAEQKIATDVLNNDDIGVVSLTGPAGSGKSLLALAQGVADVKSNKRDKVIIYRPINAVGGSQQEMGFLPGDVDEKMEPHTKAVYDTLEAAVGPTEATKIKREGYVTIEPIAYARGRTISNATIIVEEAQNLEYATILTLLTRAGANTRVFLVWDMSQRDNQYIQKNDGVYRVVKNLMDDKLFAHVPFSKSERSPISDMAVKLLDEL